VNHLGKALNFTVQKHNLFYAKGFIQMLGIKTHQQTDNWINEISPAIKPTES
jgi:hypothetical protein